MDIKQLQAVLAIAEHGSFSGAAHALGTVQSNVSSRIAKLEGELDTVLVDRATGALTPVGEIVGRRARRILDELDSLVEDVVAVNSETTGVVAIGMIGTTGRWLVPTLFSKVHSRHPGIIIRIIEGTNTTLELQLASGQIDLAVVNMPVRTGDLVVFPLFVEDLVLVVPKDHLLAEGRRNEFATEGDVYDEITLAELSDTELLLPIAGTTLREEIDAIARPLGITLRAAVELDGVRMLASLAFDGHGPAILPASAIPSHLRPQFAAIPLAGRPSRTVGVALRKHGLPGAATRVVIDALKATMFERQILPPGIHPSVLPATA